jgi:1-acyl-sn-glycerol-3-phosphate acyltransferase
MTPEIAAGGSAYAGRSRWRRGAGRALKAVYQAFIYYGLLVVFALSGLSWGLLAILLYPLVPRRARQPAGQFLIMAGFRYFLGLMRASGIMVCDLSAIDALRDRGPLIIAPNHPTLLDVMLVISRLPRVVCTAKAKLLNNPFLGASARLAGYIRNDTPVHLIREAVRQLQAGRQVLIFPEGTRTSTDGVDAFKGGFAMIAQRAGVPIQTIFIDSNSRFLGKGWSLLRVPAFPLTYRVRLGPLLAVEGDRHDFVTALQKSYCRELHGAAS